MMRLEQLELSGFKSFVDPVRLDFPGGITAVVGPNGCGKSNLADAVTWVLGEQSAKTLRGGKMEDFIFNGSAQRKPVGMGEATLVLRADPSLPVAEDGRIEISRRVFRTGESEYRLNGKRVRLKDIKDLLMDTGLGIRAYSVIEQGRIGMILSGKPQERRKLLEEAAGITRYKARKRIAEVKLEEATANLVRLDDVVSEVERNLRSLKRQANAARRYQERQAQYRELLERVLCGRWNRLSHRLSALGNDLAEATDREAELAAELSRREAELAAGRERADELAREVAHRHERHAALGATIEGRQQFLKTARQSHEETAGRIAAGRTTAARREEEVGRRGEDLEALSDRRRELAEELARAEGRVGEDDRRLAGTEERLAEARARGEEGRRELLAAAAEINALNNRMHQEQIELEKGNYRRHHLGEELERHTGELEQAAATLEEARGALGSLADRRAEREREAEGLRAALEETLAREAQAEARRRRTAEALTASRQRRELLTELSAAHAERRAALEEVLAGAGIDRPAFLSERLSALGGWEESLDFYLGSLADAVILDAERDPLDLAAALAGGRAGAALLSPVAGAASPAPEIDDPAVSLTLGQALGLPPELAAALPPAFLVEGADEAAAAAEARRLARRHPGVAFLSRHRLWAQGGLVWVEGGEVRPGVLARERELAELGEAIPGLEGELEEAEEELGSLVAERSRRAEELHRLENAIAQLRQEAAVAEARLEEAERRHQRLATEHTTLTDERDEIERELARLTRRREERTAEIAAAEERHTSLQERFDRIQVEIEAVANERESLRTESAGNRGQLDLLRERLASQEREAARLEEEIAEARREAAAWREEAERLAHRRGELEVEIAAAETELQEALEERARFSTEVVEAQGRLDEHRAELKGLEAALARLRESREEVRTRVEELRVDRAGLEHDAEHLAEIYREHFEAPLPAAPEPPEGDLAELEADLARLKESLERLGPVNVLAVQEYAEAEERHEFLTAQRADVAESVESLRSTIREINRTSSARFRETFAEVNQSFGEVFVRLFRGGEAEMRLLDEDDVLDTGIEILARPPGKRLQNIMLLSGGEKALTAIALLFALFQAKPSPFCILDEVDAPLDDPNTLRFVDLLKELSGDTQFIVITHNKLTMQIAHTLYGVTMEERGVSKVVAVELDEIHPEVEPQAASA